jgi:elongation factor P
MILASQLRPGMAIRLEGQNYKVVEALYHPGQGRASGASHTRLRNLETGTFWEHSLRGELKVEEIVLEKRPLEFLYSDGDLCVFMNPETFEQTEISSALVGPQAVFLQPAMRLSVEFVGDRPVAVVFPDVLEVKIEDTAPPTHQQADSKFKPARLECGVEVMVPQFFKTGDSIRLDMQTLKYMDRAKGKG